MITDFVITFADKYMLYLYTVEGNPIQFPATPGDHEVDIRPHEPRGQPRRCRGRFTLNNVLYTVPQP